MVALFSSVNTIDLNAPPTAQPIVMPNARLEVLDAYLEVLAICPNFPAMLSDVWQLNFTFDNRPIMLHDFVLLYDSTVVAVVRGFVLSCDQALLIDKSDTNAINDLLAFSIQGAVSAFDLARRLHVRNEEMKSLRNQTGVLQRLLKHYKQKHMELKYENSQLKKLVLSYSEGLRPKIQEMKNDTKRLQQQYEKLQVDVQNCHISLRPSSS